MQFDFTLAANGAQKIDTVGRFVKYVQGTGKIRIRINRGGYADLLPGQGLRGLDFTEFTIEDRSGAGNVGIVLAGAFEFQDDRISGTVDVVDGGKARSIANQAFIAAVFKGAVAAEYTHCQIWNPAGSKKILIIETVGVSVPGSTTGWSCDIRTSTVELLTVAGNGIVSKKSGASGSAAQLRVQGGAGLIAGSGEALITLAGSTGRDYFKFTEPYVIYPGAGLVGFMSTVNIPEVLNVEWYEEAI